MNILVTGGAGYIGSHTCVELVEAGYTPVIFDNFENASKNVIARLEALTGRPPVVVEADVRDTEALKAAVLDNECEAVIHFAALKSVGEGQHQPLHYYDNNVGGSIALFSCLENLGIRKIVFSSSATVYGIPERLPMDENHPLRPFNVYGDTKVAVEKLLRAMHAADQRWSVVSLRYFNPIGAHPSGLIGEAPGGIPNNLMPYITQVAVGRRSYLSVFGNDYETRDGTGERDYVHVRDLARAHVQALNLLETPCFEIINIGTGTGATVLELVREFERQSGVQIPVEYAARRQGDVAASVADCEKAERLMGWRARHGLPEMCRDAWNWQRRNPHGYELDNDEERNAEIR